MSVAVGDKESEKGVIPFRAGLRNSFLFLKANFLSFWNNFEPFQNVPESFINNFPPFQNVLEPFASLFLSLKVNWE